MSTIRPYKKHAIAYLVYNRSFKVVGNFLKQQVDGHNVEAVIINHQEMFALQAWGISILY